MLRLSGRRVRELLEELGRRLHRRGVVADMYVVGGAAIALAFDQERVTDDIDAVFTSKQQVYTEARAMAEEFGLSANWLNDAVKGFIVAEDPEATPSLEVPGLRVQVASPPILLTMKCLAHRPEDRDDVLLLAEVLDLANAEEVLDLVARTAGLERVTAQTQFFVVDVMEGGRARE